MSFERKNGRLFCEDVAVSDVIAHAVDTPFFLYSLDRIRRNLRAYMDSAGSRAIVAYALKANANLHILRHLSEMGAGAVLVSGGELHLAMQAGFDPARMIFNGNGKTRMEIGAAIDAGVTVNIDSLFDLEHIASAADGCGRNARVLLRVNPDIDPKVHPYVSTGIRESKFGLAGADVATVRDRARQMSRVDIVGVHCHLGSTVSDLEVYRAATEAMCTLAADMRQSGLNIETINMGGGLGIDDNSPRPADLMRMMVDLVGPHRLIVEPGRSIVGDTGILVSRVIGVKHAPAKDFIVTDGSMTELIRPSLYGAHHAIEFVEPVDGATRTFDVVGPVCESADFLGQKRELATPGEGAHIAVYQAGAYGYAMSSNYNARLRPAEYLVDGDRFRLVRRREQPEDLMRLFDVDA